LLQLAGELHNHKILDELHHFFRAGNMKAFYATAEKVLRVQCGNPVVRSVIVDDQLIRDRDQVDAAIAEFFQEVDGGDDHVVDTEADLSTWTRMGAAAEAIQGMFTAQNVEEPMRAFNFNKGLSPDGSDCIILKPCDASHRLTQEITAQILGLLGNPQAIPKYLYEGRLVPLSKNKGKDQAELKDIRPIVVRSHIAKILEKAIMAKVAAVAPHLLQTRIYQTGFK
jgi:hypothetical protein